MLKKGLITLGALTVALLLVFRGHAPEAVYTLFPGYFSDPTNAWEDSPLVFAKVSEVRLPDDTVTQRGYSQTLARQALAVSSDKQILFGDTHVHTTNSADAFMYSLPMMHGASGAYPPAYACDYARFVSQLDFYFLTDHAESFTLEQWRDGIESVRQCNRLAGESSNPDVVAFIGW